jgi:hypothetical protein
MRAFASLQPSSFIPCPSPPCFGLWPACLSISEIAANAPYAARFIRGDWAMVSMYFALVVGVGVVSEHTELPHLLFRGTLALFSSSWAS